MLRLDGEALKREAAARAGLAAFGDDPFAENFAHFVDALNEDGRLSNQGVELTRAEILSLLRNRLEVRRWHDERPEIAAEAIERPIFLMGLPRSGTTFLHHLFDHDPDLRLLRAWETLRPCPPPSFDPGSVPARIEAAYQFVGQWKEEVVNFDAIHLMDAEGPDECSLILNQAFSQAGFQNYLRVPSFFEWMLRSLDYVRAYAYHKSVLQLLQWRAAPKRWVVKYPNHILAMPEIRRVYPDAVFVVSHRDPVQTLASICDLTHQYRAPRTIENDRGDIGHEMWRFVDKHIERLMAFDDRSVRVLNVDYYRLVADPVREMAAIYEQLGMAMPAAVRAKLGDWTERNPKGKRGQHRYRLEDYGVDLADVNAGFADYRARYAIPMEYE